MKYCVFVSFDKKLLLITIEIPVNLKILAFDKATLMHGYDHISNFGDDLLMWLIILFIGWKFRGEEELAGVIFFYFDIFLLCECVVSKTHHG